MNETSLFYLKQADKVALKSKDQSTKVGAFFVDEEEISPLAFGYNGMPRGLPDNDPNKNQRPEKYLWFEHAERNAIYNSAQALMGNAIIFLSHFPNMESTRAIVSCRIQKVVVPELDKEHKHYDRVLEMLTASGVELISLNESELAPKVKEKYSGYLEFTQDYGNDLGSKYCRVKEGALILDQTTFAPIAMGHNGPPPKVKMTPELIQIAEDLLKEGGDNNADLFFIQEATKNAIFSAVRPKLKNSHAYVSFCPCMHCALALASVGVKQVTTHKLDFTKEADLRWKSSFEKTMHIFEATGINFVSVDEAQMATIKNTSSKPAIKR